MSPKKLTFELEGSKITSEKFRRGINAFLDLIEGVAKDVTQIRRAVRWIVSVSPGSLRVDFTPEPYKAPPLSVEEIPDIIEDGLKALETKKERPDHFTDYVLEKAQILGSIIDAKDGEIDSVKVRVGKKITHVSSQTIANVDSILATPISALGSVEGKLQMISERGGLHFAIYDPITDHPVKCSFDPEILDEITKAFGKRLSIYGKIRYRKDGLPKSIRIDEFRLLPEKGLPKFEDVYGILERED